MASKLLIGIAVGVVAGILLAPAKGTKTRKRLMRKGRELKNSFNDFVDNLHEKFDSVKDEAENWVDQAKGRARTYSEEAQ